MRFDFRYVPAAIALSAGLLFSAGQLLSQAKPQITTSIADSPKSQVAGSVHPALRHASDLGSVSSDLKMERMLLVLQPSEAQQQELKQLLAAQHDSNSSQYHKWLKPEEFSSRFAPASEDVEKIEEWLVSQGFQVEAVARGGLWIQFSGTAAQVSAAFETEIHQYTVDGQTRIANASAISLPQAMRAVALGPVSLNNIPRRPLHTPIKQLALNLEGKLVVVQSQAGSSISPDYTGGSATHYVGPNDLAAIYDTNPLLKSSINGTGVSIAVIGETDIELADIQTFRQIFGLPANDPEIVTVGPDPGISSGDETESDLDLEYAGALAPDAHIRFIEAGSTASSAGIDLAAAYAVDNAVAPIITLSYGSCEAFLGTSGNAFYSQMWEQAAAEGVTVFVSSGDSGSAGCNNAAEGYAAGYGLQVSGLASTPYNVAVGGTQFNESVAGGTTFWNSSNDSAYSSAIGYIPEAVWNESCNAQTDPTGCSADNGYTALYAGSGGKSSCLNYVASVGSTLNCGGAYAKPAWQAGIGVPSDSVRDIPDVSLAAAYMHDGYLVCSGGSCQTAYQNGKLVLTSASVVGGTSASAPAMAGIMALLEQKNGQYQGLANYVFYKLAAAQNTTSCNSSLSTDPTTSGSCVFHDITAGTNSVPCLGSTQDCSSKLNGVNGYLSGYATTAGYDLASGLGSVDANNLVNAWASASRVSTTTTLTTGTTSIAHGASLSFGVSVAPSSGTGSPSGDVSLYANGQAIGPFTLSSQTYSGSTQLLPGGTYSLTAHYAGDGFYASSNSKGVQITVTPESSTVTLTPYYLNSMGSLQSISGSVPFGAGIYLKTTVGGLSAKGVPSGTVTFLMDGSAFVTLPVDSIGQVSFFVQDYLSNTTVLPGTHTFSATYSGDSSFNASSTAAATSIVVAKGVVSTFAIPNMSTVKSGQPLQVYLSMTSNSGSVFPTGTIQLYDNGAALGSPLTLVSNGPQGSGVAQAEYTTSSLPVGKHVLNATYGGDSNYNAIPSGSYSQESSTVTVTAASLASTKTTLSQSVSSLSVGQSVTYTINVAPVTSSTATPTGTVTLINTNIGTFPYTIVSATSLVNGSLQVTVPFSAAGPLELFASYSGDSNFDPSVSTVLLTTINTIAPTAALTSNAAYIAPGQQSSLNFTVTGKPNIASYSIPSGAVQYYDSLNGAAQQLIGYHSIITGNGRIGADSLAVTLGTGSHLITAVYLGDTAWSSASATTTVVVTAPDFLLSAASGAMPINVGSSASQTITLTPVVSFSGTVSLACASGVPQGMTCAISPSSLTLGSASTAQVTLTSTAAGAAMASLETPQALAGKRNRGSAPEEGAALCGLILIGICASRRKAYLRYFASLVCVAGLLAIGCSNPAPTQYTVSLSSVNGVKAASGSTVHLLAKVNSNNTQSVQSGTVSFYDGTTLLNTVNVGNGEADLEITALSVGTHTLTAKFTDPKSISATSAALNQAITGSVTVQISASSGSLSHNISLGFQLQ